MVLPEWCEWLVILANTTLSFSQKLMHTDCWLVSVGQAAGFRLVLGIRFTVQVGGLGLAPTPQVVQTDTRAVSSLC